MEIKNNEEGYLPPQLRYESKYNGINKEDYWGVKRKLADAPCDHLGLDLSGD